jgi:hypothetical protein
LACRKGLACAVLVRPSFRSRYAVLADLSAAGVALLLAERLDPGAALAVQLSRVHPGLTGIRPARVVHARPYAVGWLLGCALGEPLSLEELVALT